MALIVIAPLWLLSSLGGAAFPAPLVLAAIWPQSPAGQTDPRGKILRVTRSVTLPDKNILAKYGLAMGCGYRK
jgi:hypothetical protein